MANKKVPLSIFFLIFSIIIITIMGVAIYIIYNSKVEATNKIIELEAQNKNLNTELYNTKIELKKATENISTNNSSIKNNTIVEQPKIVPQNTIIEQPNISSKNTIEQEKEQIKTFIKIFEKAVNAKDYETAKIYSNENVVSMLKKYNVHNMTVDTSKLELNPNNNYNSYYCYCGYDINYNGLDIHDLSMGQIFCIDRNANGLYISTFCATAF